VAELVSESHERVQAMVEGVGEIRKSTRADRQDHRRDRPPAAAFSRSNKGFSAFAGASGAAKV